MVALGGPIGGILSFIIPGLFVPFIKETEALSESQKIFVQGRVRNYLILEAAMGVILCICTLLLFREPVYAPKVLSKEEKQ